MTYSYYKQGGAMRAFALILASALIIALVWFVSYKNGCVTCSKTDSGRPAVSCQGCPDPNAVSGGDTVTKNPGEQNVPASASDNDAAAPESKKVSFEVVIDGRSTRFEVDVDKLSENPIPIQSEDGNTKALFEKGASTDIKITIEAPEAVPQKAEPQTEPVSEPQTEPVSEPQQDDPAEGAGAEPISDTTETGALTAAVQGGSDLPSTEDADAPVTEAPAEPAADTQQASLAPINTLLPPVTLLKGESFGMEGKVLALGRGCERRDVIVAVIPPEGNCLTLLCDTLCTQKTINAVKARYPGRIAYTYTIDCEYFVNLRGGSYFELYNCAESVDIQSGMEKPEWLTYETSTVPDDVVYSYVAKNELERFHVKGTDGCLVICEDNDVYRYERF